MNEIISGSAAPSLAGALEENLSAHARLYAGLPGAILYDQPGVLGLMTDLDVSESCVYWADFPPERAAGEIERVVGRFRSRGCLPMWWITGPSTQPAGLGRRLEAGGFRRIARPPAMAADLGDLAEQAPLLDGFAIQRVSNSAQLKQWVEIVGISDEIPPALQAGFYRVFESQGYGAGAGCRLFLGMEDGRAVAASRLFPAGGIAGIYHVATLPEARGRGYGAAMTLAAAHAGRELGYQVGGLFATPAGYRLYHRLGFQEICTMDVYQSPT